MGIIAAPRMWEMMLSDILVRANDSSALKRRVFGYFPQGRRADGDLPGGGEAGPVGTPPALPARRNSWFTGRCATSWASAARAGR